MSLMATRRKLHTLEVQVRHDVNTCMDAALRQLTDGELEHLIAVFSAHRAQVDALPVRAVVDMARPDWALPAQWAALQRYAALYWAHWATRNKL